MAVTRTRAKWVPVLSRAIGLRTPQQLRDFFNKRKYHAPYTSELRGLQLLADANYDISLYEPTEDGIGFQGTKGASAPKKANKDVAPKAATQLMLPEMPRTPAAEQRPPAPIGGGPPQKNRRSTKLVARLAKLLPFGDTPSGRSFVKQALRENGYGDTAHWKDETQALEIFQKLGVPIGKFETTAQVLTNSLPGEKNVAPPSANADVLREQYAELSKRYVEVAERLTAREATLAKLERKSTTVRQILLQAEKQTKVSWAKDEIPYIVKPIAYMLDALSEVRNGIYGDE